MFCLLTALPAEARPLVDRLRLRPTEEAGPFALYRGEDRLLVVSGPGKPAAAAALAHTCAFVPAAAAAAWLNCGIAGHRSRPPGTPLVAHRVFDAASGQVHYPAFAFRPPCASDNLITVDRPESAYPEEAAYDMEASAFFATACRFVPAELVHALKIVSDNPQHPFEHLHRKRVEQLLGEALELVEALEGTLVALAGELELVRRDPPHYRPCLERWRFTASQRHQLRRLLARRQALAPQEELWTADFSALRSGRDVLGSLRRHLDGLTPPPC